MRGRSENAYENINPEISEKSAAPDQSHTPTATAAAPTHLTVHPPPPAVYLPSSKHDPRYVPSPTSESARKSPSQHSRTSYVSNPPGSIAEPVRAITAPQGTNANSSKRSSRARVDSPQLREKRSERLGSGSNSSRGSRDLEKGSYDRRSNPEHHSPSSRAYHTTVYYSDPDDMEAEDDTKDHALWILIYLSALAPLLALVFSFYALATTVLILLASPFCHCISKVPLRDHLHRFLAPPLTFQLSLIYSLQAATDSRDSTAKRSPSVMLILINIFAPLYAVGLMIAAWIAAGFWFFGAILGDPNGKEDKDNDGRATVVYVSRWWETWLCRGL